MATATNGEIASAFLRELHAPDTPVMRKAVIAWMRAESGTTIRANNPWNMTLGAAKETGVKTCGSWTSTSSGLTFAAFCSPQDGARASARLLLHGGNDWRRYDRVVSAARANDPIRFLNALAASAWDGGRYGTKNGGANKLLSVYASLGGNVAGATSGVSSAGVNASLASATDAEALAKWQAILDRFGIPSAPDHVLTVDEATKIVDVVYPALGQRLPDRQNSIDSFTGKTVRQALDPASTSKVNAPSLDALAQIAAAFVGLVGALFDPRKWLLVLGLLAGTALTAYGGMNILAAARD